MKNSISKWTSLTPIQKILHKNIKDKSKNRNLLEKPIKDVSRLRRRQYDESVKIREIAKKEAQKRLIEKRKAMKIRELQERLGVLDQMHKIVDIQKTFTGYKVRTINQTVNYLKARRCFCEVLCLLIARIYNYYYKKQLFEKLIKEYHIPFSGINKELNLMDKMRFRLMNCYYNSLKYSRSFDTLELNKTKQTKNNHHKRGLSA